MPADPALDPPRAHGAPLGSARLRAEPEDFLVEEQLGFEASGAGQHVLLKVRKRNANTLREVFALDADYGESST